jgi:hypothetical protein
MIGKINWVHSKWVVEAGLAPAFLNAPKPIRSPLEEALRIQSTTTDFITELFSSVDDAMIDVPKHNLQNKP